MCICIVKSCCGCLDLKTGCFIIGFLNLSNGICLLITLAMFACLVSFKDISETIKTNGIMIDPETKITILKVILAVALVMIIVHVIFSGMLLNGLSNNKRCYLKTFVVYQIVMNTLSALTAIGGIVNSFSVFYIQTIIASAVNFYFAIIVNSYCKEMGTTPAPVTYQHEPNQLDPNQHDHNQQNTNIFNPNEHEFINLVPVQESA